MRCAAIGINVAMLLQCHATACFFMMPCQVAMLRCSYAMPRLCHNVVLLRCQASEMPHRCVAAMPCLSGATCYNAMPPRCHIIVLMRCYLRGNYKFEFSFTSVLNPNVCADPIISNLKAMLQRIQRTKVKMSQAYPINSLNKQFSLATLHSRRSRQLPLPFLQCVMRKLYTTLGHVGQFI